MPQIKNKSQIQPHPPLSGVFYTLPRFEKTT